MIDKIFEEENKYYRFYILLPVLLWMESLPGVILRPDGSSLAAPLFVFFVICFLTSSGLFIIHYSNLIGFRKQYKELTEAQKNNLWECGVVKIWKTYLSSEFIVQYGMFTMQIIPLTDIEAVRRKQGLRKIKGAYGYAEEIDEMAVFLKNGKSTIVEASKAFEEAANALLKGQPVKKICFERLKLVKEKPIEGITALAVMGSFVVFMGGYSRVLIMCAPKQTQISRMLFLCWYEGVFWIGALILLAICMVVIFVWRTIEKRKQKFSTKWMTIWICTIILMSMYAFVEADNMCGSSYAVEAREDYQRYQEGIYEQIVVTEAVETQFLNAAWGDWDIYERMQKYGIELTFIEVTTEDEKHKTLIAICEKNQSDCLKEGQRYVIQYLENTGIVVKLKGWE